MNDRQQKPVSPEAGEVKQPPRPDIEPGINGALADQIQRELKFRLQRAPENIVTKVGLVKIIRKSHYCKQWTASERWN